MRACPTPGHGAKLWAVIAGYLNSDSVNVDFFKSLFGQGEYYKEGWMEVYSWCGPMYHVGGTTGDCVYAIMTTTTRPNDDVWSLRDALVRAVS